MMRSVPTHFAPFRRLLEDVHAREQLDGVLSISLVHGFRLSDTKDITANVLVVTDAAVELGDEIALELGRAFFDLRLTIPEFTESIPEVLDRALEAEQGPVVVAEPYDNPGGGFPGDSTAMLRALLERGIDDVAVALLWDPVAVRLAVDAGVGARLPLRIGGKAGPWSGQPLDVLAEITCVRSDATQAGLGTGESWPIGESAAIRSQGIDVVLNTLRTQVMSPDCFTQHAIDPTEKRLLILKSAQHFRAHFDAIAAQTLYCSGASEPGGRTLDLPFANLPRPIWPLDDIDPDQISVWKGDRSG
jgi:microcystin degradation protein MlrC